MKQLNYSKLAKHYDILEGRSEKSNLRVNHLLKKILIKNKCKKILDFSCGTGAQAGFLRDNGFIITAIDKNKEMLKIAKKKHKRVNFHLGDMRTSFFGKYDAVITIFNSISHLSKKEFRTSLRNISKNLKKDGLYLFDIFNINFLKRNPPGKRISIAKQIGNEAYVVFSNYHLNTKTNIYSICEKRFIQKGKEGIKASIENWEQSTYSIEDIKNILADGGFTILEALDSKGKPFNKTKSLMMLIIARKTNSSQDI